MSTFYVATNEKEPDYIREFRLKLECNIQKMWSRLEKRCLKGTENEAEELKPLAEQGQIEAMIVLAAFYEHGIGVEKDTKRAANLFRKASAAIDYCTFRRIKDGSKRTWTKLEFVEPLMKKAALLGDDFALGKCHDFDGSLGFDKELCRRHYLRAAEKGDVEAMFCLSRTYSMAWFEKSEPDPVLEKKYLVQAAERGHHEALHRLVAGSENDAERVKWLKLLVEHCEDDDLYSSGLVYELAVRYEQGVGVPRNDDLAIKWHAKAAELGYTNSLLALARCCEQGRGVEQDEDKALELYRMAARQGSAKAMYELALCCEREGLRPQMVNWLCKSARHGHFPSKLRYAECLEYGVGTLKDVAAAVAIYKELGSVRDSIDDMERAEYIRQFTGQSMGQSAEEDMGICARAAYRVAMAYKYGKGVEADLAQTVKWLKKAAKLGSSEAMFTLGKYSESGEGMRKSPKIAARWYESAAKLDHQPAQERLKALHLRWAGHSS